MFGNWCDWSIAQQMLGSRLVWSAVGSCNVLAHRRWLFQSSCGMCWRSTGRGGGPHGVWEASHNSVSFCRCERGGVCGIAVVSGIIRGMVISHKAEGKCQALPSMVFLLRVDGC